MQTILSDHNCEGQAEDIKTDEVIRDILNNIGKMKAAWAFLIPTF